MDTPPDATKMDTRPDDTSRSVFAVIQHFKASRLASDYPTWVCCWVAILWLRLLKLLSSRRIQPVFPQITPAKASTGAVR